MSGVCDLYDYSIHDLSALLSLEGYALCLPPGPAERGESRTPPLESVEHAGSGDHISHGDIA